VISSPVPWFSMFDSARFVIVVFYLAVAIGFLYRYGLGVYRQTIVGAGRTILQLLIMGSLLTLVFGVDDRRLDAAVLLLMVGTAAHTARQKGGAGGDFGTALVAILVACVLVILPMLLTGVFDNRSSFLIPLSGMVIGNAMNTTALTLERLDREMHAGRERIEALLALGVRPVDAARTAVTGSMTAALLPSLNSMKTTGLVHIPGLMTGMLLSGADAVFAAEMQAIIIYLIFIGAVISSFMVTRLQRRVYFTDYDGLRRKQESPG